MPVRPTLLLTAVIAAAGALVAHQAGVNPFAKRENPFERQFTDGGTPTGPSLVGWQVAAQAKPQPAVVAREPGRTDEAPSGSGMQTAQAQPPPATAGDAAQQQVPAVDETALRYFASRGDTRRLEAEIARLKALYPNWTPPENPLAAPPQGDPQLDDMWRLYSEGKTAEVRKAISDRQARDPSWQVPADLLERLQLSEAREQLVNASDIKQFDTVIRLASANPAMLTCGDVDVLWRVAEALGSTKREQRALDTYLYILRNCERPDERYATVQKAMDLLPRSDVDQLLALEHTTDGKPEFEALRGELARRALVAADSDPKITASPSDLALVEKLANDQGAVSDYLLLGWYYLRRDNPQAAAEWFRKAHDKQNDAASSQGLALALINLDKPQEAEDILYRWRDSSEDVHAVYLAAVANMLAMIPQPQFSTEVLQRIVAEVAKSKDAVAAQQLGWYADGFNQFETAEQWFQTALSWKPDDEPSAYGLALMRWKLGDLAGVRQVQNEWAGRSERIRTVGEPERTQPARVRQLRQVSVGAATEPDALRPVETTMRTVAVEAEPAMTRQPAPVRTTETVVEAQYERPTQRTVERAVARPAQQPRVASTQPRQKATSRAKTAGCRTTEDPSGLSPEAALARGWCLMNLNRPIEAAAAFGVALGGRGQIASDAAYGQSLAYMRAGLTDRAAVAATQAPLSPSRTTELNAALLAARATAAFQNGQYMETIIALDERGRFVPEQNDLMVLRGYAYLKLFRYADAERIFRAVARTGNKDALRGLADVRAARMPNPDS